MKKIFLLIGLITVGTLSIAQQPSKKELKKELMLTLAEKSIRPQNLLKKMSVEQLEDLNAEVNKGEDAVAKGKARALAFLDNRKAAIEEFHQRPLAEQEKEVIDANDKMQDRTNLLKGKGPITIRAINLSMSPMTDLSIEIAVDNRFIEQTLAEIVETTVYMQEGETIEDAQGLLNAVTPLVYFTNELKNMAKESKDAMEKDEAKLIAAYMGSVLFKTKDMRKVPLRAFLLNMQEREMLAEYNDAISDFLDNVEEGEAFAVKQIERLEKN